MDISSIGSLNASHLMHQAQFSAQNRSSAIENMDWASMRNDDTALLAAAQEFEIYFIQAMFRAMRNTVMRDENSLFPRSQSEDIFQDMLDEQTARAAVLGGRGVGLAQQIFRQMTAGHNPIQEALVNQEQHYDGVYGVAMDDQGDE
jgi:Rod binding domain-containing protein